MDGGNKLTRGERRGKPEERGKRQILVAVRTNPPRTPSVVNCLPMLPRASRADLSLGLVTSCSFVRSLVRQFRQFSSVFVSSRRSSPKWLAETGEERKERERERKGRANNVQRYWHAQAPKSLHCTSLCPLWRPFRMLRT